MSTEKIIAENIGGRVTVYDAENTGFVEGTLVGLSSDNNALVQIGTIVSEYELEDVHIGTLSEVTAQMDEDEDDENTSIFDDDDDPDDDDDDDDLRSQWDYLDFEVDEADDDDDDDLGSQLDSPDDVAF